MEKDDWIYKILYANDSYTSLNRQIAEMKEGLIHRIIYSNECNECKVFAYRCGAGVEDVEKYVRTHVIRLEGFSGKMRWEGGLSKFNTDIVRMNDCIKGMMDGLIEDFMKIINVGTEDSYGASRRIDLNELEVGRLKSEIFKQINRLVKEFNKIENVRNPYSKRSDVYSSGINVMVRCIRKWFKSNACILKQVDMNIACEGVEFFYRLFCVYKKINVVNTPARKSFVLERQQFKCLNTTAKNKSNSKFNLGGDLGKLDIDRIIVLRMNCFILKLQNGLVEWIVNHRDGFSCGTNKNSKYIKMYRDDVINFDRISLALSLLETSGLIDAKTIKLIRAVGCICNKWKKILSFGESLHSQYVKENLSNDIIKISKLMMWLNANRLDIEHMNRFVKFWERVSVSFGVHHSKTVDGMCNNVLNVSDANSLIELVDKVKTDMICCNSEVSSGEECSGCVDNYISHDVLFVGMNVKYYHLCSRGRCSQLIVEGEIVKTNSGFVWIKYKQPDCCWRCRNKYFGDDIHNGFDECGIYNKFDKPMKYSNKEFNNLLKNHTIRIDS